MPSFEIQADIFYEFWKLFDEPEGQMQKDELFFCQIITLKLKTDWSKNLHESLKLGHFWRG